MMPPSARNPFRKNTSQAVLLLVAAIFCSWTLEVARAGTAEEDWQAVVALDAGPAQHPQTAEAAGNIVVAHLARQEKALRTFLAAHPEDSHAFEAKLRLSRLLQIRADFEQSEKLRVEAANLLESLEKTATPEQRTELDFSKVTRLMRGLHRNDSAQCQTLLDAARRFQAAHPTDRRVAPLLAEVATLYDNKPQLKESLLEDALSAVRESDVKARIQDDLKRVRLFGQLVSMKFTSIQGKEITLDDFAGRPVFIIFFGEFSTESMTAVDKLRAEVAQLPAGAVEVVGVDLDARREAVLETIKTRRLTWPLAYDGKGWDSPLVRNFGINMVPTVWLLDGHGHLRSLNALEGAATLARQLLREH
ncbi:MAG TPA: TlpA disulfide reductase family protein [Chthoniobacter sp.]|jgi:peroxiredoxin